MPSPYKPTLDYRRKGVGVNNVAPADHRKLVLRTVITCLGGSYRWRVMAEETQKATGMCGSRRAAVEVANAEVKRLRKEAV